MPAYYHGTDFYSGYKILRNGFGTASKQKVWSCSDPNKTYFYENGNEGFKNACYSAQITAAVHHSPQEKVMIIKIEVPNNLVQNIFPDNTTGEYFEESVQIDSAWLNQNIRAGMIRVSYITPKLFIPEFSIFYLLSLDNNLLICSMRDKTLKRFAKKMFSEHDLCRVLIAITEKKDKYGPVHYVSQEKLSITGRGSNMELRTNGVLEMRPQYNRQSTPRQPKISFEKRREAGKKLFSVILRECQIGINE